MNRGHEVFCFVDPLFFDSPALIRDPGLEFEISRRPPPSGWKNGDLDDWLMYWPDGVELPAQGWKIHASATLENAELVLDAVWDYCVPRGIAFKFIRGRQYQLFRNGKYADRGSSGKLVTIYPVDEAHLAVILTELGEILDGQPGPYILSDLRWSSGPLFVRYGGFAERYCVGPDGTPELAIADNEGQLVPDRRGPTFEVPPWVTLPECLEPHVAARASTSVADLPYRIDNALHFSNGGGLYAAVDERTGERVVLKEARPYAGLALDGADAVSRLQREGEVLEQLAGLDVVPRVHDYFVLGDHHFLVLEYIDSEALSSLIAERNPMGPEETDEAVLAEYTAWALDMYERVERAVEEVHARGIVIVDLHPYNVMVRPDGRVVLVDFEIAGDVSRVGQATLADAAFIAPSTRTGFAIDEYALACLRLFLFLPLTSLLMLDPGKTEELADAITEVFPVPRSFLDEAVRTITGPGESPPPAPAHRPVAAGRPPRITTDAGTWPELRSSMVQAILNSATPDRDDRLFPGDIEQFSTGGMNLAYGAAGVLYALSATGAGRQASHEEWLVRKATHPQPGTRLGFYDGLHGVAYALDHLGRRSEAMKVLEICADDIKGKWERLGLDLYSGLAGIGLNLAHFADVTGEPSLHEDAGRVVDIIASRLGDEASVGEISGGDHPYAGLIRGSSGPALLFIRTYERTGDPGFLDLAATALRQDLKRCLLREDGGLEVNEGWRTMPYVADGSAGIGMALDEYLVHREDGQFLEALGPIGKAARAQFYIEPGLLYGRAGMILFLGRRHAPGTAWRDPAVAQHIRRLGWHGLSYHGHLAFPGDQLLRLSMDLATGTAGVLLALGSALHGTPVQLPFLPPHEKGLLDERAPDMTTATP